MPKFIAYIYAEIDTTPYVDPFIRRHAWEPQESTHDEIWIDIDEFEALDYEDAQEIAWEIYESEHYNSEHQNVEIEVWDV